MKKTLCLLTAITCIASFTACGGSSSSSESVTTQAVTEVTVPTETVPTTTESTTMSSTEKTTATATEAAEEPAAAPESSSEFVDKIGKGLEITNITKMAAEMIGAEEGTSFRYNDNKFEIYRFKSGDPKIEQAKLGSMTYTIEGFGEITSKSSVNGDYIMIYDTPEDAVIQAFTSIS